MWVFESYQQRYEIAEACQAPWPHWVTLPTFLAPIGFNPSETVREKRGGRLKIPRLIVQRERMLWRLLREIPALAQGYGPPRAAPGRRSMRYQAPATRSKLRTVVLSAQDSSEANYYLEYFESTNAITLKKKKILDRADKKSWVCSLA
ncbi:hypothetical protein D8B26_007854 [Coccidioides posadasii str. Silveira]|uniref:uncharacterized protein n=1 Tax=Coccidioides posadasii (strain RMSCC 757 / Silveira) TaxID=443226 RepID=UPI001BEFFEA8|nr:hypothetical protein D8B26_007854 [Coccidioides posadasii str. Silveira]